MRRLLLLISAIVLVDTMFYAAITPLLPHYSDELDLSKAEAGVLVAAFPAGTLLGSLPAGWLASRVGVKPTVVLGLGGLAVSSLVFGLAEDIVVLDAARFTQGLSSAASWTAGFSWLVSAAPREHRGELIGTAFGAAVGGSLLGPVLGAAANATATEAVFGGVAVVACGLLILALREPGPAEAASRGSYRAALRDGAMRAGLGAIVIVGIFFGVLEVLIPLRLDDLGASAAAVGATFVAAAGLQALTSPAIGRFSDSRGNLAPIRAGLLAAAVVAVLLPLLGSAWLVALVAVLSAPTVGALWVPGLGLLSDGAESAGVDQAFGFALMNMTWAGAQTFGAAGGGGAAGAAGDGAVYAVLAALMAATLIVYLVRPPAVVAATRAA